MSLRFDVRHVPVQLDDLDVALLRDALNQQDPRGPAAAGASELSRRIESALAVNRPPFEHVQIDDENLARILIGAVNYQANRERATETLLRLRGHTRTVFDLDKT